MLLRPEPTILLQVFSKCIYDYGNTTKLKVIFKSSLCSDELCQGDLRAWIGWYIGFMASVN